MYYFSSKKSSVIDFATRFAKELSFVVLNALLLLLVVVTVLTAAFATGARPRLHPSKHSMSARKNAMRWRQAAPPKQETRV